MKWPLSIGQRDRSRQYDAYVIPLSAEDKIIITQKAHKRTQKDLNKLLKILGQALSHYSESHYASSKAIELLAGFHKDVLNLKERVKKETFNALPYKDLRKERESEGEVMDSYPKRLSLKQKLIISLAGFNTVLYGYGWFYDSNIFAIAIMFTMIVGVLFYLYLKYGNRRKKSLKSSKKIKGEEWTL